MDTDYGVLSRAHRHALDFIEGLDTRSVAATASVAELRARLARPLPAHGEPADRIIDELVADTAGGHLGSASGRFFGWVIGGALPSTVAADWLVTAWDNNNGAAACAPAGCVAEEVAGEWLKEILDLPREASFALVTGCQIAHVTCLAAARHAVLRDAGWNVEIDGLIGAPRIRVLANDQRHGSIERALRMIGLGTSCLEPLASGLDGRLDPETLRLALERGPGGPTIVLLDGGDLNVGGFDPYREIIPMAKAAGAWVHVDGAFGLWARASRDHRHLADGMDLADSWATDGHKWLNTPYDSGIAIVRDAEAHRASMALATSYIAQDSGVRDPLDWTPEWSRRARGIPLYAALRELGRDGVADLIDRCCGYAKAIARGIGEMPGAELVAMPTLNQGLVSFPEPDGGDEIAHAARTDATIQAINDTGECFFTGATWRGKRVMRISVVNWRTNDQDVERTLAAVAGVLERWG